MDEPHPILISDGWQASKGTKSFQAWAPTTASRLTDSYPVSSWEDCEKVLRAAVAAFDQLHDTSPEQISDFLTTYARLLTSHAERICQAASRETGLPVAPRLKDVEMVRTTNQLLQAAAAAIEGSWRLPTIDTKHQLRSMHAAIGPVVVFGPNNFPLAFNAVAGGDFAAAIAAGNPVIAKAHPLHPTTTRLMAELALQAATSARMPAGTFQLIYDLDRSDGLRLVADRRVAAVGFTGSRSSGLAIKAACDAVGKPVFLEMSSLNPVVILPGALRERLSEIANEFCDSCLLAAGQMCTNPGLVLLVQSADAQRLLQLVAEQMSSREPGVLLSAAGREALDRSVRLVMEAGANLVVGGKPLAGEGYRYANTLLTCTADQFLSRADAFQTEMFGAASLFVFAQDVGQILQVLEGLEGNLTGSIYSARDGGDDASYVLVERRLRRKVGRLNNDKMPTGVVVSPAMCHGGPYPSTGHPGFTAVGIPAAMRRFSMLQCFDRVRPERLPRWLQDPNPNGRCWRWIDDHWTTEDVSAVKR